LPLWKSQKNLKEEPREQREPKMKGKGFTDPRQIINSCRTIQRKEGEAPGVGKDDVEQRGKGGGGERSGRSCREGSVRLPGASCGVRVWAI